MTKTENAFCEDKEFQDSVLSVMPDFMRRLLVTKPDGTPIISLVLYETPKKSRFTVVFRDYMKILLCGPAPDYEKTSYYLSDPSICQSLNDYLKDK